MKNLHQLLLPWRDTILHPRYWRFLKDFAVFNRMSRTMPERFPLRWKDRYPALNDRVLETPFDAHYAYHPAWAARIVAHIQPALHVDIASALSFCAMLSAFVPVEFYDIRPARLRLTGLSMNSGNLLRLPFRDESVNSMSCMHVIEHVGLGRYGEDLDPEGDLKAMSELRRALAPGGSLLFVVPVGIPRVQYNAHRIYSYEQIIEQFADLHLMQFALIDDAGRFLVDAHSAEADAQTYGCGCWWFEK